MSQYMFLVYEEEVEPAVQAERDQRLHSVQSATSVRVRDGETEIVDGPFAVTTEGVAGYYVLACADLDEALRLAARLPMAGWATIEVRPMMPPDEWLRVAREAGADLPAAAVEELA